MASNDETTAKKNAARSAAFRRLRERHAEHWHDLLTEEYRARGLTYVRKLTEEEKAERTVRDLFAVFPDLRARMAEEQ